MRSLRALLFFLALPLGAVPAAAQGLFSPAITVNDSVITNYEIDQRARMLEVFNTPGDLGALAREQLIEDRLKLQELDRAGLRLTDETLRAEMERFAERANLEYDQFITVLDQNGVAEETLRDFVRIGVSWRDYVRSRFGPQAQITDTEVDRALGQRGTSGSTIEVLLSEIIIPAPPPEAARARATAERIAQTTSTATFSAEARRVSALPSRENGGRLGWLPISNYPAPIRALILDLAPGEVTAPIQIPNGVALFQLRDIREVPQPAAEPAAIEYAALFLPGGDSEAGLRNAARIAASVDTCDDLYGVARDMAPEQLQRDALPPAEIPQDVALELAKLDPGETSYSLTRANGETLVFLMLCGRTPDLDQDIDREAVLNQLRSQRLAGYADALLADLRASATITVQ